MRIDRKDTLPIKEVVKQLDESIRNHITDIHIMDLSDEEVQKKEESISLLLMNRKLKAKQLQEGSYISRPLKSSIEMNQGDLYDLIDSV